MPIDLQTMLRKAQKIKLPGGVVGKICWVVVVFCLSVTALAALTRNEWIIGGAVVSMFVLAFSMLWRVINFADKNPQAAILEGAEFLIHEQIVLGSKYNPTIRVGNELPVPAHPVALPAPDVMNDDKQVEGGQN